MESNEEIFAEVQKSLESLAGLKINVISQANDDQDNYANYVICINRANKARKSKAIYRVEVKNTLTSTQISEIALRTKNAPYKTILAASQVTAPQAEKMRELNLFFCDAAGNAYINTPDLYVLITGRRTQTVKVERSRLFDKAGLKIIYALLTQADLAAEDFRSIAAASGVGSISTVSDIFKDLIKQRYLLQHESRGRILDRKADLLRRWTEGFNERLRPTLNPVRFRSVKYNGRWWEDVDITEYNACWGGETGGALLTRHLKPAIATIYSDSLLPLLQAKYGLVREKKGNVEILKKFWKSNETNETAPPLVVYADLLGTADCRNIETAEMLYDKYLAQIAEADF